jgi:soluble lytic murein transglycosylase-like protein
LDPVRTTSLEEIVTTASNRYGIDPDLVLSLIRAESAFDPNAVSPKGAQGLMQLMPQTSSLLGVENPMDAAANVEGGTRYLHDLLALYHQDLIKALAAYNAGPVRVQQYRGVPPYPETIKYITRIVLDLNRRKIANAKLIYKKYEKQKKTSMLAPTKTGSSANPPQIAEHHTSGLASAPSSPSL